MHEKLEESAYKALLVVVQTAIQQEERLLSKHHQRQACLRRADHSMQKLHHPQRSVSNRVDQPYARWCVMVELAESKKKREQIESAGMARNLLEAKALLRY